MAHTHPVVDSDSRFVINSTTREISTTSDKLELIQGDHQSERITFEIPKIVEGHDMSLSDRIEVHYINIDRRTNATSRDVYIIDDAAVDGDKLTFSWLISGNATKYYGRLNFIILFECLDPDGNYTYKWNTEICKLLTIGEGISNTSAVIEDHSDILEKFKKEILEEAGEKSIQPDWNQNDSTAADYVKNRPFYTETRETVLVEESTVSFPDYGGIHISEFQTTFKATVGETYKVYWDGTIYECPCKYFHERNFIGNLSIAGDASDTGEPFLIDSTMEGTNGDGITIYTLDTSDSHTFSISGFVSEVVKIDPKYIRDMYYTADPVETVLVEETTIPFAPVDVVYMGQLESTFVPTVGETYKVSWDGTAYESTCANFNNLQVIGNLSIMGIGSDTGEPFLIAVGNGNGIRISTADTSASHTFSVSNKQTPIVKIPAKYIDKDTSGYVVVHSKDTMTQQEAENYGTAISTKEVVFIIWNGMCISEISFGGTPDLKLLLTTQNGEVYFIEKNADGLFAFSDRKFSTASFPNGAETGDDPPTIHFYKKSIQITPSGVGSKDILFQIRTNGAKSKAFDVLGNGEAVAPAIILYSSTANSTKKFRITVDDSGTLKATKVT